MNESELFELINQEIDGRNAPAESERLARLLAEDPEARCLMEELRALSGRLGRLPAPEPPADLEAELVRTARPEVSELRPAGWLGRLVPGRPGFRARYLAAAAIFLAILGVALPLMYLKWSSSPETDPRQLAGSMIPLAWGPIGPALDQLPLQSGDVTGSVSLHQAVDQVQIVVRCRTAEPLEMEICYDPATVRYVRFLQDPAGVPVQLTAGGPCLRFTVPGDGSFLVQLDRATPNPVAIRVRLLREHSVIIDGGLSGGPARNTGFGAVQDRPAAPPATQNMKSQHATTEEAA